MATTEQQTDDLRVTGVLTAEPVTNDKGTVLKFSIRKNSRRSRPNPTYVNVKVFGKDVEAVTKTLAKAVPWDTELFVVGDFVEERWQKDGSNRRAVFCYDSSVALHRTVAA